VAPCWTSATPTGDDTALRPPAADSAATRADREQLAGLASTAADSRRATALREALPPVGEGLFLSFRQGGCSMDLVSAELPARTLVVGIDPGKATNRVLLATREEGMLGEPVSLPTQRQGVERLCNADRRGRCAADGDRDRGDGVPAPLLGGRARAAPAGRAAPLRSLRDPGRPYPAGLAALQGRRP
jgi:hypothetical protein